MPYMLACTKGGGSVIAGFYGICSTQSMCTYTHYAFICSLYHAYFIDDPYLLILGHCVHDQMANKNALFVTLVGLCQNILSTLKPVLCHSDGLTSHSDAKEVSRSDDFYATAGAPCTHAAPRIQLLVS